MSKGGCSDIEDLGRLQQLGIERWRRLLGLRGQHALVAPRVTACLARADDEVVEALETWRRSYGRAGSGRRPRNPGVVRDAVETLARALLVADRYGRAADELVEQVGEALRRRGGPAERSHHGKLQTTSHEYVRLRNRLVRRHLGLVHLAVKRMCSDPELHDDLVHEGIFGLLRAVERYDPERGTRFSTYAMYWIRSEINAAYTERLRVIRVPRHLLAQRRGYLRALERLDRGQSTQALREAARRQASLSENQLATIESLPTVDVVASPPEAHEAPIDLDVGRDTAALRPALEGLDPRARAILQHRFELDGKPFLTLKRLGRHLGISRERVRQLESAALERLRGHLRAPPSARSHVAA